jgi:hypothetical protein
VGACPGQRVVVQHSCGVGHDMAWGLGRHPIEIQPSQCLALLTLAIASSEYRGVLQGSTPSVGRHPASSLVLVRWLLARGGEPFDGYTIVQIRTNACDFKTCVFHHFQEHDYGCAAIIDLQCISRIQVTWIVH